MKYVIKNVSGIGSSYVYAPNYKEKQSSYYVSNLTEATQFVSVRDAIATIRMRDKYFPTEGAFTIIGVKEVNTPRYEEVTL